MAESSSRARLTKIVLGIAVFFCAIVIVCFSVGGPLYIQERTKTQSYIKDSCRVLSTSYETIEKCNDYGTKSTKYRRCFIAIWHVQFGQNGTRTEQIRSSGEKSYQHVEAKFEQFKVCISNR